MFKWLLTAKKNLTAVLAGRTITVASDHPNFDAIVDAAKTGDSDKFIKLADVPASITSYTLGNFKINHGVVTWKGGAINGVLSDRIIAMMQAQVPFEPMLRFLDNVMENPSRRAREELYSWLENKDIPITVDGYWLGYKRVDENFMDFHSTTILNTVGQEPTMERNFVDDNWGVACSEGLHVGNVAYASSFNAGSPGHLMIVKVHPRDTVTVPANETNKCRVCKYLVIAEYTELLTWPVYEAPGPGLPIRAVSNIPKPEHKSQQADPFGESVNRPYADPARWVTSLMFINPMNVSELLQIEDLAQVHHVLKGPIFSNAGVQADTTFITEDDAHQFLAAANRLQFVRDGKVTKVPTSKNGSVTSSDNDSGDDETLQVTVSTHYPLLPDSAELSQMEDIAGHDSDMFHNGTQFQFKFDSEGDAEAFVGKVKWCSCVRSASIDHVDGDRLEEDDSDQEDEDEEDYQAAEVDNLNHLSPQSRFELRQRAIEITMAQAGGSRYQAEVHVESLTRLQMAELLPGLEAMRYIDRDYKITTEEMYPISFEIFDGEMKVGKFNVRSEAEEDELFATVSKVYATPIKSNRVDNRKQHRVRVV